MPIPTSITDLDVDEALNSPAGSDAVGGTLDDYLRAHAGIIKRQFAKGDDVASASNLMIPADGAYINVTAGTQTTISTISDSFDGRSVWLRFAAGITLKNSSSLLLPNGKDWETEEGEIGIFIQTEPGIWICPYRPDPELGTAATKDAQESPDDDTEGRLMTVGAFGLGAENPKNVADLNDPESWKNGFFSAGTEGAPQGGDGSLLQFGRADISDGAAACFTQMGAWGTTDLWFRTADSGDGSSLVFGDWNKVMTGNKTISTGNPSGGVDGDVWFKV